MSQSRPVARGDRPFDRLDELLVGRALGDLDHRERIELEALLDTDPELDTDSFDLAAATTDLVLDGREVVMPDALRRRIEADAEVFFGTRASIAPVARTRRSPAPARTWTAQALATAAVVLLMVGIGSTLLQRPEASTAPAPEELRQSILAGGDFVQWDWIATEDPTAGAVSGDVVWSKERQAGTLRIGGLAANDPGEFQYQLWIFDQDRDERYPVDGGVFDIPSTGTEVVIPIHAKLPVDQPYLFAITVERPGGVVVSSRERIAILAQAPAEG